MRITSYFLISVLLVLFSCKEKEKDENDFVIYTIGEGEHSSSGSGLSLYSGNELRFLTKFDETAIYSTVIPANQADINKLYGFSDCGSQHQQNSARFGWRWYNNRLEILAYCYVNGVREFKYLTSVELNQEYEYRITATGNQYIFSINGINESMNRGCSNGGNKYRLYPYFGGDEIAPHEIAIRIKEL